jgi:O-antigen/teichoic acid export membrane protein
VFQYTLTHDAAGASTHRLKKVVIGLSIIMALAGITIAPQILSILFPKFEYAGTIIQIFSIAIIPRTVSMMYASEFLGAEKSQVVFKGALISLIIQIPLMFILGTQMGVNGIASALVKIFQCIWHWSNFNLRWSNYKIFKQIKK